MTGHERHTIGHETDTNVLWTYYEATKADTEPTRSDTKATGSDVDGMVDASVDTMDLDAETCGFPWYKIPKLDHQINNIRHVQHHAALLSGRLRRAEGIDVLWVGFE